MIRSSVLKNKTRIGPYFIDPTRMFQILMQFKEKHNKNLIFGHINVNWLHTKFRKFEIMLDLNLMDIFVISETKLNPLITRNFNVPEYTLNRKDRPA